MHYVDRGPEPRGLKRYEERYTPGWVAYYKGGAETKPSDSHWTRFYNDLARAFFHLCGYCETTCKGEIDHFRPKSRFPERVYDWSNWIFSCHDCNHPKGQKWPPGGYVDPCARTGSSRPEEFFDFDLKTGEIIPKAGLTRTRWNKAVRTIEDLKLNAFHQIRRRLARIEMVSRVLKGDVEDDPEHAAFVEWCTARESQYSSITRAFLAQGGYFVD